MRLRVIATGGTLDKRYDPIAGALAFGDTHLNAMLERARADGEITVDVLMLIDSMDMTEDLRARVLAACRDCDEERIVVVHGTDTMVETARVLGEAALAKTVVITGAMIPFDVAGSDALFNLGFAIGCARTMAYGTWVAMNAVARPWNDVRKNRELGRFEAL